MTRKTFATLGILVVLLVSLFGTAAAQSGTDPEVTLTPAPTTETVQPGAKFFTHPVVKLLSAYFDQETEDADTGDDTAGEDTTVEEPTDPSVTPTPEPTDTGETDPVSVGEQIAAYHEDGMGFGVLVKIYAMVKASEEACLAQATDPAVTGAADGTTTDGTTPTEPTCKPLTPEELVTAVKGGSGMGTLFKQYGKPAMLGVGHVKQALKKQAAEATPEDQSTMTATSKNGKHGNGSGKGNPNKGPKK